MPKAASPADQVIELYERHARAWVADRQRSLFPERKWMEQVTALLPNDALILDIGCGAGAPIAQYFIEQGFRVTGIDSSETLISLCRERFGEQEWLVADMRMLSLGKLFHGIIAWDSFFHLPGEDQRRMFLIFRMHAAPDAALLFTSGASDSEVVGTLQGESLHHASLSPDEYRSLLKENGFTVKAYIAEDADCGQHTVWLAQLAE